MKDNWKIEFSIDNEINKPGIKIFTIPIYIKNIELVNDIFDPREQNSILDSQMTKIKFINLSNDFKRMMVLDDLKLVHDNIKQYEQFNDEILYYDDNEFINNVSNSYLYCIEEKLLVLQKQ